jgi:hypothetical protein
MGKNTIFEIVVLLNTMIVRMDEKIPLSENLVATKIFLIRD